MTIRRMAGTLRQEYDFDIRIWIRSSLSQLQQSNGPYMEPCGGAFDHVSAQAAQGQRQEGGIRQV